MNIDQIIGKLMGDGSVGEERSALDAWKKEAEDNIKALEDIHRIDSISNTLSGYKDFDVDTAWDSFSNNINNNQKTTVDTNKKEASIFSMSNMTKIAAMLILVVGSVFVFNQYFSPVNGTSTLVDYSATSNTLDFDLNDGTHITLDKLSDLKVLESRSVTLKGRAYFVVEKDKVKQFKIDLPIGNIVVLGTEFTVDAEANTTEVFVHEGSVRYEFDDRTYVLVAGDLLKVVNNVATIHKGRDDNYDSWKNQRLMFRDNNMVEVVDALSRHFKKEIIIENKKAFANCNVINVFTNAKLEDILNELSKSHTLKYHLKDNKIIIVSAKC